MALAVVVAVGAALAVSISGIHFLSVVIVVDVGRISSLVCVFVFGRSRIRLVGVVRILVIVIALAIFIVVGRTRTSSSRSAIFVFVCTVAVVVSNTTGLSGPEHQRVVLSLSGIHGSLVGYRLDAHVEDIALCFGQSRKPL